MSAEQRPAVVVQVGSWKLRGPWAPVIALVVLAALVALYAWTAPPLRMVATLVIWIAFQIYWSAASVNSATAVSGESDASRAVHRRMLNVALLLLVFNWPGLRTRFVPLTPAIVASGFVVQVLGFALAAWARACLGRNWSHKVRVAEDHELVRSGPYRRVRHPIYTAMFMMFAGTALIAGEVHALIAFALLVVAYTRKIRQEERLMRETFGPAYEAYQRESGAVIPWLL